MTAESHVYLDPERRHLPVKGQRLFRLRKRRMEVNADFLGESHGYYFFKPFGAVAGNFVLSPGDNVSTVEIDVVNAVEHGWGVVEIMPDLSVKMTPDNGHKPIGF